jgi:hypothetical protein
MIFMIFIELFITWYAVKPCVAMIISVLYLSFEPRKAPSVSLRNRRILKTSASSYGHSDSTQQEAVRQFVQGTGLVEHLSKTNDN